MKFPADFIEKVRDANNLVDLIAQHTQLKPMAGGFMGRCPFPDHQEKTPSFSVSETKQVYNCFGCHKKGNIFTFLEDFMGLSFPDAVEYLAAKARIPLPEKFENSPQQDQLTKKKKEMIALNQLALQYFQDTFRKLKADHPVKKYAVDKRGMSQEILNEFQIGYATPEWDGLVRYLQSKGASLALAEEARLIKIKKEGSGYFDIFRDRLMFPILNQMNEPVGFGGRIIEQGEPKYLNSGETLVFNKSKILFGLSHSAKYIRSEDQAIVVEGYMDLISLYQSGIKNVVAPMGTALTSDHAKLLSRMTKNICVLFDGDEAGQNAAERSLPILLSSNLHPKGLILPDDQDPDDFVRSNGSENLRNLMAHSPDLFMMIFSRMLKGYRGEPSEKVRISDLLRPIFASIQDARLKKLYLQEVAQKIGVDEAWMSSAVSDRYAKNAIQSSGPREKVVSDTRVNANTTPAIEKSSSAFVDTISIKGASPSELMILNIALKNANNFSKLDAMGFREYIIHSGIKTLLEKAAETYRQTPEKFDKLFGLLTSFVDEPDKLMSAPYEEGQSALENADVSINDFEKEQRLMKDCFKRIKDNFLKTQADLLTLELKRESSPEKLELLMKLQRDRMALNKEQP